MLFVQCNSNIFTYYNELLDNLTRLSLSENVDLNVIVIVYDCCLDSKRVFLYLHICRILHWTSFIYYIGRALSHNFLVHTVNIVSVFDARVSLIFQCADCPLNAEIFNREMSSCRVRNQRFWKKRGRGKYITYIHIFIIYR